MLLRQARNLGGAGRQLLTLLTGGFPAGRGARWPDRPYGRGLTSLLTGAIAEQAAPDGGDLASAKPYRGRSRRREPHRR